MSSAAPIDGFGVGTKLAVMADAPDLDMAYKLVEYAGKPRLKLSTKKVLYPGRKQVFRQIEDGQMAGDVIGRFDEPLPGERLLQPLLRPGQKEAHIDVKQSRKHVQEELERLPVHLHNLEASETPYPVRFSDRLQTDLDSFKGKLALQLRGRN